MFSLLMSKNTKIDEDKGIINIPSKNFKNFENFAKNDGEIKELFFERFYSIINENNEENSNELSNIGNNSKFVQIFVGNIKEYLDNIYKISQKEIKEREMTEIWIEKQIEKWLRIICKRSGNKYGGFSKIIAGSNLYGIQTSSTDLDIIFIIPKNCLIPKSIKCPKCKNEINSINSRMCKKHDLTFGSSDDSLYKILYKVFSDDKEKKFLKLNPIANTTVPLFDINFNGIDMDIMIAPIARDEVSDTWNF
uniref:Polynucleotide adenylyltransferase n=1 Tax=Meloidogyne floridensis TaxID=298350 RepID=A0A915NV35_9BILA